MRESSCSNSVNLLAVSVLVLMAVCYNSSFARNRFTALRQVLGTGTASNHRVRKAQDRITDKDIVEALYKSGKTLFKF